MPRGMGNIKNPHIGHTKPVKGCYQCEVKMQLEVLFFQGSINSFTPLSLAVHARREILRQMRGKPWNKLMEAIDTLRLPRQLKDSLKSDAGKLL